MPRDKVIKIFTYEELSDEAKEKARYWYRESSQHGDWWDIVYEDFHIICKYIGVELSTRPVKLMGGGTRQKPDISFSGFCSQGDGASFSGRYRYNAGSVDLVKSHAPQDVELHRIADNLSDLQGKYDSQVVCDISQRGFYSHSGTMRFDFFEYEDSEGETFEVSGDDQQAVSDQLRLLAVWLYDHLEKEYDWLNSDEVVAENIIANEYEFDEYGNRE